MANIFQPLIKFFEWIIVFFHNNLGFSWGFGIIALTICVRMVLLPLAVKQYHSMQNLLRHQPELKKIQAKYKGDRERLNQEMMKFYKENKVNPMASCLPLLAQLPVFISLFYMLREDFRRDICPGINPTTVATTKPCGSTPASQFLGIPDLTNKATGIVLIVLLILYVVSQLSSTLLTPSTADKNQRILMMALPLVFVAFIWQFPAGLLLYWITTNFWTVGQQFVIRKLVPMTTHPEASSGKVATATAPAVVGRSGRAQRAKRAELEEPTSKKEESSGRSSDVAISADSEAAGPPPRSPRKRKKRSGRRR